MQIAHFEWILKRGGGGGERDPAMETPLKGGKEASVYVKSDN